MAGPEHVVIIDGIRGFTEDGTPIVSSQDLVSPKPADAVEPVEPTEPAEAQPNT